MEWEIAPNSRGEVFSPGLGLTWSSKNQSDYTLNLLLPQTLKGDLAEILVLAFLQVHFL